MRYVPNLTGFCQNQVYPLDATLEKISTSQNFLGLPCVAGGSSQSRYTLI